MHILPTSATMVGVCMTVLGIIKLMISKAYAWFSTRARPRQHFLSAELNSVL
jgi:hypothetical protein